MSFTGKTIVITGGTGALGAAVVEQLVARGAHCIVPSHRGGNLHFSGPGDVSIVPGIDLADEAAVEKFYDSLPSLWASIHAAGGFAMGPIAAQSKNDFLKMIETNALSAFLCCREAVKKIRVSGTSGSAGGGGVGRIVNVAAKVALTPAGGMVAYSMSKAAVVSLTQSLAEEVANDGIWVNAVLPSIMDTPANRASFPPATDFTRWPTVADVAQTILFLASEENRVTRGALVPVYGRA